MGHFTVVKVCTRTFVQPFWKCPNNGPISSKCSPALAFWQRVVQPGPRMALGMAFSIEWQPSYLAFVDFISNSWASLAFFMPRLF